MAKNTNAFARNPKLVRRHMYDRSTRRAQLSRKYAPNGARECARRQKQTYHYVDLIY